MKFICCTVLIALMFVNGTAISDEPQEVKEQTLQATNNVTVKVRAQGPYDMETPLQVVCYFKHRESGDTTLGAAVELDKELGGVISSLRNRSEFAGDELETLLLTPPQGTIKPKLLLIVGLGEPESLSTERMEHVGRTALREAARLGIHQVAFAPLIRDQGNMKLAAGDVAQAVIRGVLLAYRTDKALQKEGLANEYALEEWVLEAGPMYFDDTIEGVKRGINEATEVNAKRPSEPYSSRR